MLLPALSRAKARARDISCLNNVKQLENCWHLYALDHNDILPPNNSIAILGGGPSVAGFSWCTNYVFDANPDGIQYGLLFPYNTSLAIYHCPADRSTITTLAGVKLNQLRWRSYNMSLSINGAPELNPDSWYLPSFKKYTQIMNPDPAKLWVFIDTHEEEIFDATFGMPNDQYFAGSFSWWDIPANRHSQGSNLSFGDGHAERFKWRVPKVVTGALPQPVPMEERPDFQRLHDGYRQHGD